jgi:hypothetical protein
VKKEAIILVCSLYLSEVFSQNLDKIGKKDMAKVSGGLNFNSIYLNTNNPDSKRDPFSWYLSGNLSLTILDWSLPFSCSVSNQSRTFSQPFNQYGVMPTYKWIKLHAGWSTISFSPYTLSGHPFLGGGVELSPKNWKVILLYGRFKKAVEYDVLNESDMEMSYKRMGLGAKIAYEKKGYGLSVMLFKAGDDPKSLKFIPENTAVRPQENTVISAAGKAALTKYFNVEAEYTLSGFTRNVLSEEKGQSQNKLPFIFKEKASSQFFAAYKISLSFNSKFISVAGNYERIDPEYKTLGAYYFNNDLENITLAPQFRMFKNKLILALNGGVQQNNLNKERLSTMRRMVGSGTISFQPNKKWMLSGAYSNFTSFTRNRPNTDPFYVPSPADTMRFYQVSQSANGMLNYNTTKGSLRHNFTLSGNYQVSAQQTGAVSGPETKVSNANATYGLTHTPSKFTLSITGNINQTLAVNLKSLLYGPGLSIGKSFAKNTFNLSFGSIYNASFVNDVNTGSVFSERLSLSYSPKVKNPKTGKPSFSISCNYINKPKTATAVYALSEFTGNVNLSYGF